MSNQIKLSQKPAWGRQAVFFFCFFLTPSELLPSPVRHSSSPSAPAQSGGRTGETNPTETTGGIFKVETIYNWTHVCLYSHMLDMPDPLFQSGISWLTDTLETLSPFFLFSSQSSCFVSPLYMIFSQSNLALPSEPLCVLPRLHVWSTVDYSFALLEYDLLPRQPMLPSCRFPSPSAKTTLQHNRERFIKMEQKENTEKNTKRILTKYADRACVFECEEKRFWHCKDLLSELIHAPKKCFFSLSESMWWRSSMK